MLQSRGVDVFQRTVAWWGGECGGWWWSGSPRVWSYPQLFLIIPGLGRQLRVSYPLEDTPFPRILIAPPPFWSSFCLLPFLQRFFRPNVKLMKSLLYFSSALLLPSPWTVKAPCTHIFVRIWRKREGFGQLAACRMASPGSQPIIRRAAEPILHGVPAPRDSRKTQLLLLLLPTLPCFSLSLCCLILYSKGHRKLFEAHDPILALNGEHVCVT